MLTGVLQSAPSCIWCWSMKPSLWYECPYYIVSPVNIYLKYIASLLCCIEMHCTVHEPTLHIFFELFYILFEAKQIMLLCSCTCSTWYKTFRSWRDQAVCPFPGLLCMFFSLLWKCPLEGSDKCLAVFWCLRTNVSPFIRQRVCLSHQWALIRSASLLVSSRTLYGIWVLFRA